MKTPPRNNYANTNTPIASIKRPRSSMERTGSTRSTTSRNGTGSNSQRRVAGSEEMGSPAPETCLTPMHPPKPVERKPTDHVEEESSWVGRKVDALFSPVITYFNQQEIGSDGKDNALAQATASESSSSPSNGTTCEEEVEDDNLSIDSMQPMDDDNCDDDEFNPWQFIKSLPAYDCVKHLTPADRLPPKSPDAPPITLVLDLDETLVHCTVEDVADADLSFPVLFHGVNYQVNVRLRPYLDEFFKRIHGHFEVIVFTASQKVYANELLDRIDPGTSSPVFLAPSAFLIYLSSHTIVPFPVVFSFTERKYIQHRLFRESCLAVEGNFLKDLHVLGRDLTKTVLVDNSPHAFGYQVDNGIPIESWFEDPSDRELLKLAKFVKGLRGQEDVRPMIRHKFQSQHRVDTARKIAY
jgi:CTD small phosphatase-like protein 2